MNQYMAATHGLEELKNRGTQCSTMAFTALVPGVGFDSDEIGLDEV